MQVAMEPPTPAVLWDAFTRKARQLGATVERAATEADAAELVARSGAEASPARTRRLAERFGEVAARCASLPERAAAAEGVAAGALAIAETGSVLLAEGNRDRGACFLADHLWLLVHEADVAPTLDAALGRLGLLIGAGSRHVVLVSGPSRTADIERTLTIGVHGPGRLTIVVVGGAARPGEAMA